MTDYCCFSIGQLGELGPVNTKTPNQAEVTHCTCTVVECQSSATVYVSLQAAGPEPVMDSDEEGEDLQERLQALRS